jgi:hypothetical protein
MSTHGRNVQNTTLRVDLATQPLGVEGRRVCRDRQYAADLASFGPAQELLGAFSSSRPSLRASTNPTQRHTTPWLR